MKKSIIKCCKLLSFLLLSIIINFNLHGQDLLRNYEIGHFVDINKQRLSGYFDFSYEPEKTLNVTYTIGLDYTPGYYYDMGGTMIKGLLKYTQSNTFFKFKSDHQIKERTIKPDDCLAYVIGVDSFTVLENFDIQTTLGAVPTDKREFVEVIDQFQGYTFYKYTHTGSQNMVSTYLVKPADSPVVISFPKGAKKFKDIATDIFGSFNELKEGIESRKYKHDDIPSMIKMFKYKMLHDQNKNVYFNASWDETDKQEEACYYANIGSVKDSIFHMRYHFMNGYKIYEGEFTSFYPHKKRGNFKFYYPYGTIRKSIDFINNKPEKVIEYYSNGKIHRKYSIFMAANSFKEVYNFTEVYNEIGENVLDESGTGMEVFFDPIAMREITYEYVKHQLINVYYHDNQGKKVYQLCEKNASIKGFKYLNSRLKTEVDYPKQSIIDYNYGLVLVKCVVEPNGATSDIQIIKRLDPEIDRVVLKIMDTFKLTSYWNPGKVAGVAVKQEIVVPFNFSIEGFSRYRTYYNDFWMHQHMMHQLNPATLPQPPRF